MMGDVIRKEKGKGKSGDHGPLPREHYRLMAQLRQAWPPGSFEGSRILAAVSGGSDSMALLELLSLAATGRGPQVRVCYIDHRTRPAGSFETAFVGASARRLGFDFEQATISDPGRGDEDHLRRCRYRLLEGSAEAYGADWIVTGHTRDDQIETVLFRFLRGAGLGGLGGMRTRRGKILRPLLAENREQLREFLRDRRVGWLEDPSNSHMRYTRNRIRSIAIPALERAVGRGALAHLPMVAKRWQRDEAYLDSEARRFAAFAICGQGTGSTVDLAALATLPEALRARVLRIWIVTAGGPDPPTIAQLEQVEAISSAGVSNGTGKKRALSADLPGLTVLRHEGQLLARNAEEAGPDQPASGHGNFTDNGIQGRVKRLRARPAAKP